MIIMKRNGSEEQFNINKIISAISKANSVDNKYELTKEQIESIANEIQSECLKVKGIPSVNHVSSTFHTDSDQTEACMMRLRKSMI